MSEMINNSEKRKALLKELILQLHSGEAPEQVRTKLVNVLHSVPYSEVVEVEQQLIAEGLPPDEVQRFCDIHTAVLDGHIEAGDMTVPCGHPVDTFRQENRELERRTGQIRMILDEASLSDEQWMQLRRLLNELADVDKHYRRKEYLLFPFLEKAGITGPPKVMWGKHDETRALLKTALKALAAERHAPENDARQSLTSVIEAVEGMIMKEEQILLPMCLDALKEEDWYRIYFETPQFGYCLYDPQEEWKPAIEGDIQFVGQSEGAVTLSTGSFDMDELEALFSTLPFDISFVDRNDRVKFFSHGQNRIFERNRAVLGRDVRMCHPPQSVHIVERIIDDFKSGRQNRAAFWISDFKGKYVYIEYIALRCKCGDYLGVLEITHDIAPYRALSGDRRLLEYDKKQDI
jgi:DUF438 domain-containing protein